MAKRDEPTQRLNLVLPITFVEKLREVAKDRFNAKVHQVTGQVEITKTLIRLIELGLDYVTEQDIYEGLEKEERPKTTSKELEGLKNQFLGLADELERVRERVKALEGEISTQKIYNKFKDNSIHIPTHNNECIDARESIHINNRIETHIESEKGENEPVSLDETERSEIPIKHSEPNLTANLTQSKDDSTHIEEHLLSDTDNETLQEETIFKPELSEPNETSIETVNKIQMSKILGVSPSSVGNWVKAQKWDKFPSGWQWNPKKELFYL